MVDSLDLKFLAVTEQVDRAVKPLVDHHLGARWRQPAASAPSDLVERVLELNHVIFADDPRDGRTQDARQALAGKQQHMSVGRINRWFGELRIQRARALSAPRAGRSWRFLTN